MSTQDDIDYQNYLDDHAYQQYLANHAAGRESTSKPAPKAPPTSALTAAGAGASQALTLGYSPQIVGGIANMLGGKTQLATGQTIENNPYVESRDATDQAISKARSDRPGAYYGANLAGNLATGKGIASVLPKAAGLGAAMKQGAAVGGTLGVVSNPGETPGRVNPVQAGDRALAGLIGAGVGAPMAGMGYGMGKLNRIGGDMRDVTEGRMSDISKGEIDAAIEQLNAKQLAPRDAEIRALLSGDKISVNPDRLTTVPRLAERLATRATPENNPYGQTPGTPRADIRGERALDLRRALDAEAGYGKSKPFDPVASARGETAKAEADVIRRKLAEVPGVAPIQAESAEIMALRDALASKAGTNPVAALQHPPGSDPYNVVKSIDKLAGSNLTGRGQRIATAQNLLPDPGNLNPVRKGQFAGELARMGARGAIRLSEALSNKIPVGAKEAALLQELEAMRKHARGGR